MTKLANQIIVALNIAAMSEALVLAAKAGVDPERSSRPSGAAWPASTVLNAKVPMVLDGNFKPGFRIELHIKDLHNALDTGHEVGAPLPLTGQVMEIMQALQGRRQAEGRPRRHHPVLRETGRRQPCAATFNPGKNSP